MGETFAESELYPMLPAQPDVCEICFQWSDGFPLCHACKALAASLDDDAIDARSIKVLPISLAPEWDSLARSLWGYKNDGDEDLREVHAEKVRALLDDYVLQHGMCLGRVAGGRKYEAITWVPSAQGSRVGMPHPMVGMVQSAKWNFNRAQELLMRTTVEVDKHRVHPERFAVTGPVAGKSVLVVDDTWTTGSNAMSAAWSLRNAGAESVSIVVIGRWNNPNSR